MTAAAARFKHSAAEPADEAPIGFARAVLRRMHPRLLLWAILILAVTDGLGRMSRYQIAQKMHLFVPPEHDRSELLIESVLISCVMLGVLIADEAVARGAPHRRTYLVAMLLASALGAVAQWHLLLLVGWDNVWRHLDDPTIALLQQALKFLSTFLYGTLACFAYVNHRTAVLAAGRLRYAELARAKARRRTLESRLQAMQARVEPEFLFNTLAQVSDLYERDAAKAGQMLEDLIAYLRAALPHLRESSSTVGQEVALARAYLDIVRIAQGEKLVFAIDLPAHIARARMPPMMLLPLIDHVLARAANSGEAGRAIAVAVTQAERRLMLSVGDSGDAFQARSQSLALDGIRQRLQALFGDGASLELGQSGRCGTLATLTIPHEAADPVSAA